MLLCLFVGESKSVQLWLNVCQMGAIFTDKCYEGGGWGVIESSKSTNGWRTMIEWQQGRTQKLRGSVDYLSLYLSLWLSNSIFKHYWPLEGFICAKTTDKNDRLMKFSVVHLRSELFERVVRDFFDSPLRSSALALRGDRLVFVVTQLKWNICLSYAR